MESLVLDGKKYVKASKAARDLGYATDYVGQLCRSGKVSAHLIGRTWYVHQDELGIHRVEKKRTSRVKAREYARKALEEHKLKVTETQNISRNIDIQYESDPRELIPKTRKIPVESVFDVRYQRLPKESDIGDETEIINEGQKVLMSGDLDVVDLSEEPSDTIILSPSRIRRGQLPTEVEEEETDPTDDSPVTIEEEPRRVSFTERLQPQDASTEDQQLEETLESATPIVQVSEKPSLLSYILFTLAFLCLTLAIIPVYTTAKYNSATMSTIWRFDFSIEKVVSIIQSKI